MSSPLCQLQVGILLGNLEMEPGKDKDLTEPGHIVGLDQPHDGLKPLAMDPTKWAQWASDLGAYQGHSKRGKDWYTKASAFYQYFPLEHSLSTALTIWTARQVDQEHSPPPVKRLTAVRMATSRLHQYRGWSVKMLLSTPSWRAVSPTAEGVLLRQLERELSRKESSPGSHVTCDRPNVVQFHGVHPAKCPFFSRETDLSWRLTSLLKEYFIFPSLSEKSNACKQILFLKNVIHINNVALLLLWILHLVHFQIFASFCCLYPSALFPVNLHLQHMFL